MSRRQEQAAIRANGRLQGEYFRVDFDAPGIVPHVRPGQFVHLQLPAFEHRVLRRPFSIFDVDLATGRLSVVYKVVGEGTQRLSSLDAGVCVDLMGPLGNGYSDAPSGNRPVLVAGGYGCAATYLFAKRSPVPCTVLIGGRTEGDVLLTDAYEALGCDVRVSTDDGSLGHKGLVTELLEAVLVEESNSTVVACGPNPMLRAVGMVCETHGIDAQLSLDHVMCCGVGACFACVVKIKTDNEDGWEYIRTCKDGPVFRASQVNWD
ncbi:MAG: dihydroorotate dehydrogenase electron transfer subunit [Lentisphaeria bacterium]|nr:dihydroorotate dehydrogenase electron transfer subunit [Lentisphaeria bacterium]